MLRKKTQVLAAGLCAIICSTGFSSTVAKDYDQGHEINTEQMMAAYNAPARINVSETWDVYLTGSFIYWEAREKGLDFARLRSATPDTYRGKTVDMGFQYKPGFKVGMGIQMHKHDDWNIYAEYTRLDLSDHNSCNDNGSATLVALWLNDSTPTDSLSRAQATWKLNHNVVDVELGRPSYLGSRLVYAPFGSIRAFFIYQKLDAKYTNEKGIIRSNNKSEAWAVGPRLGLKAKWLLGDGFYMYGNPAASLAFQRSKFKIKQYSASAPATLIVDNHDHTGYLTPNYDLGVGFGWQRYFMDKAVHFDLVAGYDFHYFHYQNEMRHQRDLSDQFVDADAGNLAMHGLTVTVRFDF